MKIDSKVVDGFGHRLAAELAALTPDERSSLLIKIGRTENRMRSDGQDRPVWKGPAPETDLLGRDVVIPTPMGEQRGRVMCFGVFNMGQEYERSVYVRVPSSGTQYEAPGSAVRLATPDDSARIENEIVMAERLTHMAVSADSRPRSRSIRDPALTAHLLDQARNHRHVAEVIEGSVNHKIVGKGRDRRIYLFKAQVRVDLSGFTVSDPAVRQISEREARDMHLGSVRGQIDFSDRAGGERAFALALSELS